MALTPMMQQYLEIKEGCKDCILFFRLGDFYEMFFEDAKTASKVLELVLTGRDCGLDERAPMCGIPYHAADSYISRLIENGFKVAICEQVEDPAEAKGIVRREIIRIVTPGTLTDSNMLDEKVNNFIGCIHWYKDGFALGICDISTGQFMSTNSNGNFDRCLDEMSKYSPSELIVIDSPSSSCIDENGDRIKRLHSRFDVLLTKIHPDERQVSSFTAKFGEFSAKTAVSELLACTGLYFYIAENQKNSLNQISNIEHYEIRDYMMLDATSRKNLELTETIRSKGKKGSLLWVLDKTRTPMGGRMLRRWIEQPLIESERINERLDVAEEFVSNIYLASDLREFLKNVYDMERLISRISSGTANARDLSALKESIRMLPDIKAVLSDARSPLLQSIYRDFDPLADIYELIDQSIEDNPPVGVKEGGLLKNGYDAEVDRLREAMTNGKQWIVGLEAKERELTGVKSLKVSFNRVFGYYIEITKSNYSSIPEDRYIRKQTLANAERFITQELKEMEATILGAEQKIIDLEYELFVGIRSVVAREILRIQQCAMYLATIDVLLSFAHVSFENNYNRPEIGTDGRIVIHEGRHPVVERVLQNVFVPNDTYLDNDHDVIAILTGPNMAGKSTYMRQVALITLLAQIGCFVPAQYAQISIVDRIFTRIGASDDLSTGQSTFMVEMSEVSNILENATSKSLVILDEVGRGTSTFDGLSIAWSVVEYISKRIGAKTLFATHYHELTELEGKLDGIKNYCISVKEHGDDIIFLRKMVVGGADQSYGIQVAKLAGLPEEVVKKAKELLHTLEEKDIIKGLKNADKKAETAAKGKSPAIGTGAQLSLFDFKENELITELKGLDVMQLTPISAMNVLYGLVDRAKKMN